MSNHAAYQALSSLAALSRKSAKGLPAQIDSAPRWSGVGFSFMGWKFVTPMGQMSELMDVPSSTRLPGVQPWVIGLSNVRGRLLPLFDLAQFFGGHLNAHKKNQRVLVLETEALYSGIVVDRAYGMQHFSVESFEEGDTELPGPLHNFIKGSYRSDINDEKWFVFSLSALSGDTRFINAAMI